MSSKPNPWRLRSYLEDSTEMLEQVGTLLTSSEFERWKDASRLGRILEAQAKRNRLAIKEEWPGAVLLEEDGPTLTRIPQ